MRCHILPQPLNIMKFDDITNRMCEKQKKRPREAKTKEDLDSHFKSDMLMLTEDQRGSVVGGILL